MTELTLKEAWLISETYRDGLYEITVSCRAKDMEGVIRETTGLKVVIKGEEKRRL